MLGPGVGNALVVLISEGDEDGDEGSRAGGLLDHLSIGYPRPTELPVVIVGVERLVPVAAATRPGSMRAAMQGQNTSGQGSGTDLGGPPSLARMSSLPPSASAPFTPSSMASLPNDILQFFLAAVQLPPANYIDGADGFGAQQAVEHVSWVTLLRLHAARSLPSLSQYRLVQPAIRQLLAGSGSGGGGFDAVRALVKAALRPLMNSTLITRASLSERRRTLHRWLLESR